MRYSRVSLLFAALALAGVAGKLATNVPAPDPGLDAFRQAGAAVLRAQGFAVWKDSAGPLRGRKGRCAIVLGDYSPYGTFADLYAEMARPVGPLRFAWRGATYGRAPKLRPLIEYYVEREFRRVGIALARHPIAAFAITPGCRLDPGGWQRLASLPTG